MSIYHDAVQEKISHISILDELLAGMFMSKDRLHACM